MIDRLITLCLHKRTLVFVAAIILALFGGYCWKILPVEAYPDLGAVNVVVTTQVPGLAAEEIEQQVTVPLERSLASTPGLIESRSSSTFGLSLITLIFNDQTNVYFARERVTEQLAQVTMPAGVVPNMSPVTGPAGEIYRYTVESDKLNLMQLSDIENWVIIPALQQVPGVAAVNNFGGFTKEYQLVLKPAALLHYGVGVNDVINAINNNNANSGGGRVSRGEQSYIVRGIGMVRNLQDMGQIVVTQNNGVPVLLKDLGELQMGHQVREGILGKDNNPDTIEGIVQMLTGQNPSEVLDKVHAKIAQLQKQLGPKGVKIVPYIDRDQLVNATIEKVTHTVIEGCCLVFVVLILFLGSPRSALVAATTIPLALATVFIIMHFTGQPANLFSLGAIDFGVIVDGAIVVTEAILRIREEHPQRTITQDDVLGVTGHIGKSIFFATSIIIVAYAPLFAFEAAEGKLFKPMAFTVSYALFGALMCALTLIPALAYLALRKPRKIFHNKPLEKLHHGYRGVLAHMIDRPWFAYGSGVVALILVVVLGASIGREFLPNLDEGTLWMQVQMPTGLSLDKASEISGEIREAVREFPETSYIVTQLGRSDAGTDAWSPSHIESAIGLTPYSSWPSGETNAQFVARLHKRLDKIPGISFGISQPIADNMNDLVGGAHSPLVLRIYGHDLKELRRIANQIVDVLQQVPGTTLDQVFQEPPVPQLDIEVNRLAAARYGINASDINAVVANAIGDSAISTVYVGDRQYNMTVHVPRKMTNDLQAIAALPLTTSSGTQVPLGQVTHISLHTGEGNIAHEMNQRQLTLRVDNGTRPLSDWMADAQHRIDAQVHFDHSEYRLEWAGTFQQAQRAQARLSVAMLIVLAVMLVLLFGEFRKLRQAVLVLGVVPLATLGGLVSLHLRGETLNIATAVGFIALFGVAVQNGIIMVASFNRMRAQGLSVREAVLDGAGERFRPVLMTATVASIGMLPAALATGIGTDVQRGLATVVVGGLVIATLLTLFILPTYYCEMEMYVEKRAASRPGKPESM